MYRVEIAVAEGRGFNVVIFKRNERLPDKRVGAPRFKNDAGLGMAGRAGFVVQGIVLRIHPAEQRLFKNRVAVDGDGTAKVKHQHVGPIGHDPLLTKGGHPVAGPDRGDKISQYSLRMMDVELELGGNGYVMDFFRVHFFEKGLCWALCSLGLTQS